MPAHIVSIRDVGLQLDERGLQACFLAVLYDDTEPFLLS